MITRHNRWFLRRQMAFSDLVLMDRYIYDNVAIPADYLAGASSDDIRVVAR